MPLSHLQSSRGMAIPQRARPCMPRPARPARRRRSQLPPSCTTPQPNLLDGREICSIQGLHRRFDPPIPEYASTCAATGLGLPGNTNCVVAALVDVGMQAGDTGGAPLPLPLPTARTFQIVHERAVVVKTGSIHESGNACCGGSQCCEHYRRDRKSCAGDEALATCACPDGPQAEGHSIISARGEVCPAAL